MKSSKFGIALFSTFALLISTNTKAETLQERLIKPGSHVAVSLDIPFEVVQALILGALKPSYSGQKNDPAGGLLRKDKLTWTATPGPVTMTGKDGQIHAQAKATGSATIKGKAAIVKVSETARLGATANLSMRPQFRTDWGIEANAKGKATLGKAEMRVLGAKISIRSLLQPALDGAFNKAIAEGVKQLRRPALLRSKVAEFWVDACRTVTIGKTPLNIIPRRVAVTQPVVGAASMRATVVVTADTVIATPGTPLDCPALPAELDLLDPLE